MDSRDAISELFDIPKDEIVYESFSCTYHGAINSAGKLYLCDKHLCYYASIAGVPIKHATKVEEIESVAITEEAIEVTLTKEGKSKVN